MLVLCTSSDDALMFVPNFMKKSQRVSESLSGQEIMTDGQMDGLTDEQTRLLL